MGRLGAQECSPSQTFLTSRQRREQDIRSRKTSKRRVRRSLRGRGRPKASRTSDNSFIPFLLFTVACATYDQSPIPTNRSSVARATGAILFSFLKKNLPTRSKSATNILPIERPQQQFGLLLCMLIDKVVWIQ